jgi:putative ubiquitin-RnfH superfamily antitoxin RatB of RatAB toxin-antitoxin module
MTKAEIIEQLEGLVKSDNIAEASSHIKELIQEVKNLNRQHYQKLLEEYLEEGGKKEDFAPSKDELDRKFDDIVNRFFEKKEKFEKQKAEYEQNNYIEKLNLIEQIKKLHEEEYIGKAISRFKEIQEKWKTIGNVPQKKYKDIQSDYSTVVEDFYYNLRMAREILDYDRKRNGELKLELIEKIKELIQKEDIKEIDELIKVYRNEWEEIGPTEEEKWQEIRAKYHDALNAVYSKMRIYFEKKKAEEQAKHQQKIELLEQIKAINNLKLNNIRKWLDYTQKIFDLQKQWKQIGYLAGKEFEKTWEEFKHETDVFFENKSKFFNEFRESQNKVKKAKKDIIDQAIKLKDSTDWKKTTEKYIQLQKKWRDVGLLSRKEEQKIWTAFREICDSFFNAKKQHFEAQDAQFESNLTLKQQILEKITAFEPSGNLLEDKKQLQAIQNEFKEIGFVPFKHKAEINNKFYSNLDSIYEKMNLDAEEKQKLKFKSKLDSMALGENAQNALSTEFNELSRKINELNADINQYENNLGFFSKSKGAEKLLKDVEDRIKRTKKQVAEMRQKQNVIKEMLNQLNQAQ